LAKRNKDEIDFERWHESEQQKIENKMVLKKSGASWAGKGAGLRKPTEQKDKEELEQIEE
jgi:hypothetical protein